VHDRGVRGQGRCSVIIRVAAMVFFHVGTGLQQVDRGGLERVQDGFVDRAVQKGVGVELLDIGQQRQHRIFLLEK
jgi:hypothetical protein